MRTPVFLVVALAALASAGCGNHNLVLDVDLLSYLDASQRTLHVEAVPPVGVPGEVPILDQSIGLIEGLDQAAAVRSVTLSLAGTISVEAGAGSGRLRLYLSEVGGAPSAPVMDVPVTFAAGSPAVVDVTTEAGPEVARLFAREELQLRAVIADVAITTAVVGMVVNTTRFDAVVIAGRKIP